ncbi:DUF6325 family protein [uncultured Microbacterium sp.]|uniref:DUF6325 family protein n=1 Tax=uncultured Microbacterium sp. TaxID=191216 RepID=UPI0035C99DEA
MAEFEYGPVELHLVGFEGDRPAPGVIAAIVELIEAGAVRLLDFIIVSKTKDGEVTAVEIEDDSDRYGFGTVELAELGIAGEEDIEELAEMIPPGASAAIVAYELVWAKRLAESLATSGGFVIRSERIPAPVVNALVEAAQEEEES